jgi:hypothetical protein
LAFFNQWAEKATEVFIMDTWMTDIISFQGVVKAARNGCKISILVLDPLSDYTVRRWQEMEESDAQQIQRQVEYRFNELIYWIRRHQMEGQVTIRLYDERPVFPMYATGDRIIVGLYCKGYPSREWHHYEFIGRDTACAQRYLEQFNTLWHRSKDWRDTPHWRMCQQAALTGENPNLRV